MNFKKDTVKIPRSKPPKATSVNSILRSKRCEAHQDKRDKQQKMLIKKQLDEGW